MIECEKLLKLFTEGKNVDETTFYFNDDKYETIHYIGYMPQYEKPYWTGCCDIENGCEFNTAEKLFTAPIYEGKSIKDRYNKLIFTTVGGIDVKYL